MLINRRYFDVSDEYFCPTTVVDGICRGLPSAFDQPAVSKIYTSGYV